MSRLCVDQLMKWLVRELMSEYRALCHQAQTTSCFPVCIERHFPGMKRQKCQVKQSLSKVVNPWSFTLTLSIRFLDPMFNADIFRVYIYFLKQEVSLEIARVTRNRFKAISTPCTALLVVRTKKCTMFLPNTNNYGKVCRQTLLPNTTALFALITCE
jgi:hypothetical protein